MITDLFILFIGNQRKRKLDPLSSVRSVSSVCHRKHKWEQSNFYALLPFVSDNLAYYFLSQAFFSHPASSLQHALVESQAAESDLQQGAAASTVSTSTDSADTSVLAGLLPQEVTAKENATATAAKNNLVFILKNLL